LAPGQLAATRAKISRMRAGVPTAPIDAQSVRRRVFRVLFGRRQAAGGCHRGGPVVAVHRAADLAGSGST
jgi:hypothetical protein